MKDTFLATFHMLVLLVIAIGCTQDDSDELIDTNNNSKNTDCSFNTSTPVSMGTFIENDNLLIEIHTDCGILSFKIERRTGVQRLDPISSSFTISKNDVTKPLGTTVVINIYKLTDEYISGSLKIKDELFQFSKQQIGNTNDVDVLVLPRQTINSKKIDISKRARIQTTHIFTYDSDYELLNSVITETSAPIPTLRQSNIIELNYDANKVLEKLYIIQGKTGSKNNTISNNEELALYRTIETNTEGFITKVTHEKDTIQFRSFEFNKALTQIKETAYISANNQSSQSTITLSILDSKNNIRASTKRDAKSDRLIDQTQFSYSNANNYTADLLKLIPDYTLLELNETYRGPYNPSFSETVSDDTEKSIKRSYIFRYNRFGFPVASEIHENDGTQEVVTVSRKYAYYFVLKNK